MNPSTIFVQVDANSGFQRTAAITISADGVPGSQMTVNIAQASQQAELEIDSDIQTVDFDGADISFGVSKTGVGTINWSAQVTAGLSWVHITTGTSESNEGLITAELDANSVAPRTAFIKVISTDPTVSPKTLIINQDISNDININGAGGTGT